jgi:hypothetical protein
MARRWRSSCAPIAPRSRQADAALQSAASVHDLLERGRRAALADEPVMSAADAEARACELRAVRDAS